MSELLVQVTRCGYVESRHYGDVAIINGDGKLLYKVGDPYRFTFWRSAAKPFQAIPLVESGGIEKYNITQEELALMTSSHGGEDAHVRAVRGILNKIHRKEAELDCGIAVPMHGDTASKLLREGKDYLSVNNACSGKHAAMLALGDLLSISTENYILADHPIQQMMHHVIAESCNMPLEEVKVAVDGCGVPVFGMGINEMALAYARLSKPESYFPPKRGAALRKILNAMIHHPFYVAGTDRLDTVLMQITNGRIVAKLGAESVYCVGIVDQGIGICLKIDDGNYRAIDPVIIDILKTLGFITPEEFKQLEPRWKPKLYNHRKDIIGELIPVFSLLKCE